jgi:hypothetical protein
MFGNSKKWQEVKSGDFGGCGSNSQPNFTNFGAAARDRFAGTLGFFFGFPPTHRQICPIIEHNTAL